MSLHETQTMIENEMHRLGEERYRKAEERALDGVRPGQALVSSLVAPLADRVSEAVEDYAAGKAGRYAKTILKMLEGVDPRAVAYIALRRVVHAGGESSGKGEGLTSCALSIGTLIEEHTVFEAFRGESAALANWWMNRAKETDHPGHAEKVMRTGARGHGHEFNWTKEDRLKVGTWLVEQIEAQGMAKTVEVRAGKRRSWQVSLSEATWEFLTRAGEACILAAPFNLPMVVEPLQWATPFDGGYLTKRKRLVTGKVFREHLDELASADLSNVYRAVNAVQQTPWRVNPAVFAVLQDLKDSPAGAPGIPAQTDPELPPRPAGIPEDQPISSLPKEQQDALDGWRRQAKEVHNARARLRSQRLSYAQKRWVAEQFAEYDRIYFPQQLDSRGRMYSMPTSLNPQGDDLAKGLLHFADGIRLGEAGAGWLAVHIANVWGEDKVGLEERIQWVHDNEEMIMEVALSPADTVEQWACADKPWQFLAAAFEWAGYVLSGRSEDYVSHVPVALDGSCSGLQHFSAALRDEVGGAAVNLTPSDTVQDVYSEVAGRVNARLNDSECGDDLKPWRGHVDRKVVKQSCMTYAYSATVTGMRDQIIAAVTKKDERPAGDLFPLASKLAPVVREEIENTVQKAAEAMRWLQQVAGIVTDNGMYLRWVSASGFPVRQCKSRPASRLTSLWYSGVRLRLVVKDETMVPDRAKQREGISPNWIHSQDSAHLVATVNACMERDVVDFAVVHDSFGTHAGNVPVLYEEVRRTFVDQYSVNRLAEFRDQVAAQLPPDVELPALPVAGSLDLEAVKDSSFFFA